MKDIDVNNRRIGVNFESGSNAHVRVWAPFAQKVELLLSKEAAKVTLKQADYGYWVAETDRLGAGDNYKILLDNETERPDPASLFQPEGVHGCSAAINPREFKWTDAAWQNHPLGDYVFYELHTGTFTPEGSFKAIVGKLDYLADLGITAIEIMPVGQFPGTRNWGYDGVCPFAVQNSYGGPYGLADLVDACHARGIAVVLDVVYNHMGPEGNYFNDFGPYFTEKYNTPWGNAINYDDAWCDGVRSYFIENALMWFRDFHIDALRLDAVHAIKDFSPKHILKEIKEYADQLMEVTGRTHYLITELDLNDPKFIEPLQRQGYGMDAQWIDEFHHALRVTAGGEKSGYYADFSGINHLAKAYTDAYVYDGIYSPHRQKNFGAKTSNPGHQFVVFSQNHDQVGNRMLGERTSQLHSFEMQKLLAAAVIVSPYLPMLFMGEEWGETNPFQYFISHTDKDLIEAVRAGRKKEFEAFHNEGETPDPQAEVTFQRSKLQWDLQEQSHHKQLLNYYKALIGLRKEHPVLQRSGRAQLSADVDADKNVLLIHRWHHDQHILCVMNFSGEIAHVGLPAEYSWRMLFASADARWCGNLDMLHPALTVTNAAVPAQSIIIYHNDHV
ncbi:malto-oligosyltrehalose trehalohydrolase [Mucilaginibacter hurinus]|uniref:Malto-oligosyltrehalose trehalohydrolase n=1 Tax=Mucilaginibacter hurinus TaxID=2201324 RepID=A0A367GP97_9SPHI|nr:malto-oligosyltrehalose trehalohydrolase [Mucilaginibacter hurinus]RCH55304.1 malto-oligosyltrehalose trehalohydrolase [Mucilaginibacter hurinus]